MAVSPLSLQDVLHRDSPMAAADIARALGVSQPTVSRLIAAAGNDVVRIGKARAARYALARRIGRLGSNWPFYCIDASGKPKSLGRLHAIGSDQFLFMSAEPGCAFTHGDFASGVFPGLPWFMADQRPQGFLGRAFAHRHARELNVRDDVVLWSDDDVVVALLRYGAEAPGHLVLGEENLQAALRHAIEEPDTVPAAEREHHYPQRAMAALRGDVVESSAAGEQPKFAVTLATDDGLAPVIVKFSDSVATPSGRRWADLLVCEAIATEILRANGIDAAHDEVVQSEHRVFLQSLRFDRTPARGRQGFVSLASIDGAFYGHGRIAWWRFAPQLHDDGWISAADADRLAVLGWFGELIGNTDMHLGNAALRLDDRRPFALLPAYDMTPMRFRPGAGGEVVARDYVVEPPIPESIAHWQRAAKAAQVFWRRCASDERISDPFRAIAADAEKKLVDVMHRWVA
jgi:hypothetical protein